MFSCAGGFAALCFRHGRSPSLDADVRAIPVGRRSPRQALDAPDRAASPQAAAPLQRALRGAGSGHGGNAVAAPQGTGARGRRGAARHRRAADPGRVPPHRQGPRARAGDRRARAVGRAMDSVADRIFLETTRRFAPPRLAREDVVAALRLAQVEPGKPVADLGCGYGRHLEALIGQGHAHPIGIDRSPLLLDEARALARAARLVRADLRALPLHAGSIAAAFCFYSSMFLGTDADSAAALREAARVLRPGGALVLTTDNPLRLAARPQGRYAGDVPGLGRVAEESVWDAEASVDRVTKTLWMPGGEELSATFSIRYYAPPRLADLASAAGFSLRRLEPDVPLTEETPQLIALLEKVP